MGGLLYKDYVSIRGKKVVCFLAVLTVLFGILCLSAAYAGTPTGMFAENYKGEEISLPDAFILTFALMLPVELFAFIEMWIPNIIKNDEKNKLHGFLSALPVSKRTYIASKYVFIGICIYASFSLCLIWNVTASTFLEEGYFLDLIMLSQSFSIEFFSVILIGAAIELPVFVAFGKEKGQMIKMAILEALAFLVVAYLFFGDLNVFEKIDIDRIMVWADTHSFELTFMSVASPLITILGYYISYRISVHIYERKERDYE